MLWRLFWFMLWNIIQIFLQYFFQLLICNLHWLVVRIFLWYLLKLSLQYIHQLSIQFYSESWLDLFSNSCSHSDLLSNSCSKQWSKSFSWIFIDIQFNIFFPHFLLILSSNSHSNITSNMNHGCILKSASFVLNLHNHYFLITYN